MGRSYDISKRSELHRFFRDLDAAVMNLAEESVSDQMGNVCPYCGEPLRIRIGTNLCTHCGATVEFTMK